MILYFFYSIFVKAERPGRGRKRRNSEMEDFIVEDHQQEVK